VLKDEDVVKADELVNEAAVIRANYSKCTDKKTKERIAMKHHTASEELV
jgi:hypothetical protein